MNIPTGHHSFIPVWRVFAILLLMATLLSARCQAAFTIHATPIPRHPSINTWVTLHLRGLPVQNRPYQFELRDPSGGPVSAITTTGQQPVLLPVAFIKPISGLHWRLQYQITEFAGRHQQRWRTLRINVEHSPASDGRRYLLLASHRTQRHLGHRHIDTLRIGVRTLRRLPPVALAAFSGGIIGPRRAPLLHPSDLLPMMAAGIPIYQFGASSPPAVNGLAWRRTRLARHIHCWVLAMNTPPPPRPLATGLRRIRLPQLAPPASWRTIVIACGLMGLIVPLLAFAATSGRRIGWRVGWMLAASVATAAIALWWINRAPQVNSITWRWQVATKNPAMRYSIHWSVVRALSPAHIELSGSSALPVAWNPRSWRHLHATINFSYSAADPNNITFRLPMGAAAIIQTQRLQFGPPTRMASLKWLNFANGRLRRSPAGTPIGMDDWLLHLPLAIRPSIRAWLVLGREGYADWRIAVGRRLIVQPLLSSGH